MLEHSAAHFPSSDALKWKFELSSVFDGLARRFAVVADWPMSSTISKEGNMMVELVLCSSLGFRQWLYSLHRRRTSRVRH